MSAINLDACPLDKHVRLRQGGQQVHPFPVTLAPSAGFCMSSTPLTFFKT